MPAFTTRDLRAAIGVLHSFCDACASARQFARHGLVTLSKVVPSDLITLSVSDFDTSHRSVMSNPASATGCREREVLDWLAHGKTNRDIAAILGTSTRTVEKHLKRVYRKLGVETRTAAVMRSRLIRHPGSHRGAE